jgi:hypothetical protein
MPRTQPPLLLSLLIKGAPQPVLKPVSTPSPKDGLPYGEYLVTLGVCEACHTPRNGGSFDATRRFAGGNKFEFPGAAVVSANISPDGATGIGNWTEEYFLDRFRRHRTMAVESLPPMTKEQFTIMPWRSLSNLKDDDLRAIYRYLMSRPAVENASKASINNTHNASSCRCSSSSASPLSISPSATDSSRSCSSGVSIMRGRTSLSSSP